MKNIEFDLPQGKREFGSRKGYYKGKYTKEWHIVTAFLLTVAVVMAMNQM